MNLIKLHRKFLINKISAILIVSVILIGFLINIFSIISLNKEYNWFAGRIAFDEFLATNILYYKLVVINLICYIWGNFFVCDSDSYHLLVTGYKNIKLKYVITKVTLLIFLTIIIVLSNFYLMSLAKVLWGNFDFSHKIIFESFIYLLLICIIYGLLSIIFSLLFRHIYSFFLAVGLFVLGELIKDGTSGSKLYFVFFPMISNNYDMGVDFGIWHVLILFVVYFFVVLFGYLYKK